MTCDSDQRERRIARFRSDVRVEPLERTAHHVADEASVGEFLDGILGRALPIAQHRYAIAKRATRAVP